ncbi:MAG: hypothetical protein MJZ89_00170 [Paludibacteraceae bacterium]|nr:hypothetical protein [Paludibacteraceae bacterium]
MNRYFYILLVLLTSIFCACKPDNNIVPPVDTPTQFTTGQVVFHGPYYANGGCSSNVLSVDLFSEGLRLTSQGKMEGTGANLYFSDIFLAPTDTTLMDGEYVSDTTAAPFTFLPGANYEANVTGAYLLQITDNKLTSISLLPEARITVSHSNGGAITTILVRGTFSNQKTYQADFDGTLRYVNRSNL